MMTRALIKTKVDEVGNEYLDRLYNITESFVKADNMQEKHKKSEQTEWADFIEKFAGCLSDDPIERGTQGEYEIRENIFT
jgi:fatty acid-binding protein DegV